ncbi:hypothetical protein LEP1GSC166_1911 [Leptospira kirschneri]|uniref:hypothetical protein n=1 Tax=Leptospira kirschneri TaxID=29507 RepID=UPI0002BD37A6|nr:hypothetical protein [Leptospira kirschneri]EMK02941.1 hypothetical protein LEP1GSC166_1911 [Leptospira kirschneri]
MGYSTFEGAIYGQGEKAGDPTGFGSCYGSSVKGEPTQSTVFQEYSGGPDEDSQVQFTTSSGALTAKFPLGVKYPIVSSLKYVVDETGSKSGEMKLAEKPDVPLPRFASFKTRIDDFDVFKGYIYDPPSQFEKNKNDLSYKMYGMRKRLEEVTIENDLRWNIQSIEITGTDNTDAIIRISANSVYPQNLASATIGPGMRIRIRETEDSENEGYFEISDLIDSLTLRIHNPSVIAQTVIKGYIEIYPIEWSEQTTLISDLVKQVFKKYGQKIPLFYSENLIQPTVGRQTLGWLDLGGMTLWKFVDLIQHMLGGQWFVGVDGNGYYFLREKRTTPIDKLSTGFDYNDIEFKEDTEWIWNKIKLFVKDENGSGSKLLCEIEDLPSQHKYGVKEPSGGGIDVPASFTEEIGRMYLQGIIAVRKDPRWIITINNAPFKYYEFGDYVIPTSPGDYVQTLGVIESLTGWVNSDTTKAVVSLENTMAIEGAFSQKFILQNADSVTYRKTVNRKVYSLQKILFWVYCTEAEDWVANPGGSIIFSVGETTFDEHPFPLSIGIKDSWVPFEWDVSNLGIQKIGEIGFTFKNAKNCILYIDDIQFLSHTTIDFVVPLKEVEYNQGTRRFCKLSFGSKDNRFENYLSGYLTQIETQKIMIRK